MKAVVHLHLSRPYMNSTLQSRLVKDALVSGTSASALSALVLSLCSKADEGSLAGGLNGPSQWVWGEAAARTRRASWKHTALGYLIHHSTSVFWALIYERLCGRANANRIDHISAARVAAEAGAMAAAAFVVDYGLTPRRFRPGFEKHVTPSSMVAIYAAFGAGLALATLLRRGRDVRSE
jgi:hypothetical protein